MPVRPKCVICDKACRKNQQQLECAVCSNSVHRKCSNLSISDIQKHKSLNLPFYCRNCKDAILPLSDEENSSPFFDAPPDSSKFDCDAVLDAAHLNELFSTPNDVVQLELDKDICNNVYGFQPISD